MKTSFLRRTMPVVLCSLSILSARAMAAPSVDISVLAKISTLPISPPAEAAKIIDGDPVQGLAFPAGSKGEGFVTLTFPSPREIDKVRVLQGHAVYYSTSYRLVADADGDGTFEIALAEKPQAKWGQWDEFIFASRKVKALRFESLAGVSQGLRAHPVVNEIQVFGEPAPNELAELMSMSKKPMNVPQLKPLFLETPLVQNAKAACAILVPEGTQYRKLGEDLARRIQSTLGAAPRVTSSMKDVDPVRENIIALGQMNNNKIIERLYWNRYLYLDSLYPAKSGYVIQTVHNPYPWTSGHNVVVLGGSTLEGTTRATQKLIALLPTLKNGVLPRTLQIELPPPAERETSHIIGSRNYTATKVPTNNLTLDERTKLLESPPEENLLAFQQLAQKYLLTGEEPYAQAARRVLGAMAALYEQKPERDMTWPEETNSRFIFAAWDAVEEAPVFSDAERVRFSEMLLKFLHGLVKHTSDYGRLEINETIIWNHTTFPLLGLYFGGRYFRRGYNFRAMDVFLEKAKGAFRGQEKSWKPQEDADSYITLTMAHMIEYALAEDDLDFFTNGNMRKYADYLIGICDNRGFAAGFGDSGLFKTTAIPDAGMPYAFWWTKDPQYLGYLNHINGGRWPNPFDQSVVARTPTSHIGMRVFELDKQVYDYTKTRSYYGEETQAPNIPYEQAFDKIAFRQNFDARGQYFILDGYSRGKHLQYDGNALLKLTDKGYDWLIDADYLVRNTTDHNMISVIRDGRSEKIEPEATALLHSADLPSHAFTETMVKDYNGADWHRFVFWQKGGAIVMLDRVIAREAGEYKFDNVFKFLDLGSENIIAPNRFQIRRGIVRAGNSGLDKIKKPDGKEAIVMSRADSQMQWQSNLKSGQYRVTIFAKSQDTGSDSLWLTLDGDEPIALHIPVVNFGPSSANADKEKPSPNLQIKKSGAHLFTLTSRENAGTTVERIVIEDIAEPKNRVEFEAANAPPMPIESNAAPEKSLNFYIVNADGAAQTTARRIGSPGPVKYLQQRRAARFASGQQTQFANLLYLDDRGEAKNAALQMLPASEGNAALLATLPQPTLLGTGNYQSGALEIEAAMFRLDAEKINLVDASKLNLNAPVFSSPNPLSLELDWTKKTATIITPKAGQIQLFGAPVTLKSGTQTVTFKPNAAIQSTLSQMLKTLNSKNISTAPAAPQSSAPATAQKVLWQLDGEANSPSEIRDFTSADLDNDGTPELLICRGNELRCYSAHHKLKWTFSSTRRIRAVTVADLDNNGRDKVLCGGDDETLHILDGNGKETASHKMIERLIVGQGGSVLPFINNIAVDDLDGDGQKEIVVGMSNSQISAFDTKLERLWNQGGIFHGAREVKIADINGDGKKEVLAANHYGSISVFTFDGKLDTRAHSELGDVAMDAADLDGDGKWEIANGSSTGTMTVSAYIAPGQPMKRLWGFSNSGYSARRVVWHDIDGDKKLELLVASDTGFLYILDATGKLKEQIDLGSALLQLAIWKTSRGDKIVVGQRDGSIKVLNLKGEITSGFSMSQPVKLLKSLHVNNAQSNQLVAVDESNNLVVLQDGTG